MRRLLTISILIGLSTVVSGLEKKKKDITFYSDADMERLLDEWEENDEEVLEEDELPPHKRKQNPPMDMESMKAKAKNPEDLIKMSKKGQTIMMFVGMIDPSDPGNTKIRTFSEHWTSMWQSQLYNNHVNCDVFIIEDNRAIFMFREGSQAFEAKDFLVKQSQVTEITLEGSQFPGAGARLKKKTEL